MLANNTTFYRPALLLLVMLIVTGCGGGSDDLDTTAIVADVVANDPLVKKFNELYPEAKNLLAVHPDDKGKATWSSDVILLDNRYHFYLEFEADIDVKANTLTRTGEPLFYLAQNPETDWSSGTAWGDLADALRIDEPPLYFDYGRNIRMTGDVISVNGINLAGHRDAVGSAFARAFPAVGSVRRSVLGRSWSGSCSREH